MTAGAWTEPARCSRYQRHPGMLTQVFTKGFRIVGQAAYVGKDNVGPRRSYHAHAGPLVEPLHAIITLPLEMADKFRQPLATLLQRRDHCDLREHRHSIDRAGGIRCGDDLLAPFWIAANHASYAQTRQRKILGEAIHR